MTTPKFDIQKTIVCHLVVDCKNEYEAQEWASKIVATIEDENGDTIESSKFESFEAESILAESRIDIIES